MKTFLKYFFLFICFGIGVAFAIGAMHAFVYPGYFNSALDAVFLGMFAALFLLASLLLFRWQTSTDGGKYRLGASSQNRLFKPAFFDKDEEVNRREFQSAMTDGWHYIEGTKQVGPVDLEEIKAVVSKISDPRNLLVWKAGFNDWQRAGEVPELETLLYRRPPPPIAPFASAPAQRDWKWTLLQSIFFLLIVSMIAAFNGFWQLVPKQIIALVGIAAASVLTVALPRKVGRKLATLGIILPVIALGAGVLAYTFTVGTDDNNVLAGRARSEFVEAAIDACVKKSDNSIAPETVSQYCRCSANGLADRLSTNELKSLSKMKQEEATATIQTKTEAVSERCRKTTQLP